VLSWILMSTVGTQSVGNLLREWRQRRRLSQLELALDADISSRHLSFVETGRSQPSREMLLRLAEQLDVPLRDRNTLLIAAGFAPVFEARPFADPELENAREAVNLVLAGHEPNPTFAIDRHWIMVTANRAAHAFLTGVEPWLLQPPLNVLRLTLHPGGVAPRIVNYAEWRSHLLSRLRRQIDVSGDTILEGLLKELRDYPPPVGQDTQTGTAQTNYGGVVVPLKLTTEAGVLSFISTTTVFGTAVDITLSELALETFFPSDPATSAVLSAMAEK